MGFNTDTYRNERYELLCVCAQLIRPCPTLCDPMDCNLPGSSVLGIFPARMLEWVALSFFNNLLCQDIFVLKTKKTGGFPGGPVVKSLCFPFGKLGFDPFSGN